ncbi:MAG: flagellar motor switch protein FliM [Phycisphaeraceae bacterium]
MADVLDQNEVDALLAAISGEEGSEAIGDNTDASQIFTNRNRKSANLEIRPYDFKRPERVSKDQMRALEQLHDSFSRSFGIALSGFLRTIVEVTVANIEQLTYGEFTKNLPNPTSYNLLSCEPLEGEICLEISPLIIYPIIDRLLGGSNADLFIPQRPLTQIEQRLVSKITDRAVTALSEAWASVSPINFKLEDTESNPQLVQIVPPNEVVVVIGFELKMGARAGSMSLCIPFNVIEPLVDKLASQTWGAYKRGRQNDTTRNRLASGLDRASVVSTAVLAETTITLEDLLNMAPGDLIMTDKPASQPVVLAVEGRKKFLANLGQFKGNRALKVTRPITAKDRF